MKCCRPVIELYLNLILGYGKRVPLIVYLATAVSSYSSPSKDTLESQIILHPENRSFFALHSVEAGQKEPSLFYLMGPGGPEDFLYRGSRNPDGTRSGDQMQILEQIADNGGNALYFQSIRSHGGDGAEDHNPFNDPSDPSSGLNPKILAQWREWFDYMESHGIALFFFIYDDGVHAFEEEVTSDVSDLERDYVAQIVEAFQHYPGLIWIVQEEFKYFGQGPGGTMEDGMRKPNNEARRAKMIRLAEIIKEHDDHGHLVGVHHNWNGWNGDSSDPYQFEGVSSVDIYVQQADVYHQKGKGTPERMHEEARGALRWNEYPYVMGEGYNLHKIALREGNRTLIRQANWACALGGAAGVMVLGTWESGGAAPSDEVLGDMRRLEQFIESIEFIALRPRGEPGAESTAWVASDAGGERHLLYAKDRRSRLSLSGLAAGSYELRWFDPADGSSSRETRTLKGSMQFKYPAHVEEDAVLYVSLQSKK